MSNKKPVPRYKIPPLELLIAPETPSTMQAIAVALSCLPELDGKTLILKTNPAGTEKIVSFLLDSSQGGRKVLCRLQGWGRPSLTVQLSCEL